VLHTTKSLKNKKIKYLLKENKIHGIFYFLSFILDLIINLLNPLEFDQYSNIHQIFNL